MIGKGGINALNWTINLITYSPVGKATTAAAMAWEENEGGTEQVINHNHDYAHNCEETITIGQ